MSLQIVKLTDPIQFTNVAGGLVPRGAYNAGTDYAVGDSVDYNGSSYVMHTDAGAGTLPTDTTKWQVLANKGDTGATGAAGTTDFNLLTNKPTLGTSAAKDIPATGNASATEVVYGTDTRLTDSRPASDVSAWAKAPTKPTYTKSEVGLSNVDNTSDANKPVSTAQQTALNAKANASDTVNLASRDYIASRGPSLVTNGQALLGDNYNFSLYTLDKTDKPTGAAGSFVAPVGAAVTNLDEFMAINPARIYEMSFAVRQAAGDGARVFYSYLAPYDIDKLPISPYHYMEQAGTRTTLAAPLNPGDTTITLTSSANWNNAAGSSSHLRTVIVWNYVDGQGYAWPAGTYSRNLRLNSYNDGAISGNVITLSTPWNLPAAPAGTAISNGSSGGSYMYGAVNVLGPSTWTNYAYKYSGIHSNNAVSATTSFPIATAYIKAGFLCNYPTSPANPTSIQKFANVALVDITEANNKLPLAGGTMTGTLVLPNSVLASSGQISSSMSIGLAFSQSRGGQIRSWGVTSAGEFGIWNDTTAQLMLNVLNDRILLGGSTGIIRGTGFPEGVVTANVGSIYIDTAVTNGIAIWYKKTGTSSTGWIPLALSNIPPATATSTGISGQTAYDSNYYYICVATNTWKRTPLSSW